MDRVGRKKRMKAYRKAWGIGPKYYKPKAFDTPLNDDESPQRETESLFSFYNRSTWDESRKVRSLVEDCIKYYPKSEAPELISRIRSGDDRHFISAAFELFLHEILRREGFILTPHPILPNGSTSRPDFLVQSPDGDYFYLEAVLATEKTEVDAGSRARRDFAIETLSRHPHDNFVIDINEHGSPKSPPSAKKLSKDLHRWLDNLDPDTTIENIKKTGNTEIEPYYWSHDGWQIEINPLPLPQERRGKSNNLVAISSPPGGFVDSWTPIRDAIKFKGKKYGELNHPLVVAVNINNFHLDKIDEMQALYGQEIIAIDPSRKHAPLIKRAANGVWKGNDDPGTQRVSAAWIFNDLRPSSIPSRKHTIYVNPWVEKAIPTSLYRFPTAKIESGKIQRNTGLSLMDIFDLNEEWPREK